MRFKDPWLLLCAIIVVGAVYLLKRKSRPSSFRFSSGEIIRHFPLTAKVILAKNIIYVRVCALLLMVLALARPLVPLEQTKTYTEGIDIVLAVDCSGSMLAEDFKIGTKRQNRLEAVKKVVEEFIRARAHDRIGMVAFAARAYTVCPLTLDYDWLIKNLERVRIGEIEDGTAVGSAISSSLNRLKDTPAKTKIIILLTDGINNTGKIAPLEAANAAQALGIKIYTIGAGTKGLVPYPMQDVWGGVVYRPVKIEIDEETLQKIAQITNGRYFRATDTESLRQVYQEIDRLEKTRIEETHFQEYKELFPWFLIPGLFLIILEVFAANTVLRTIP